MASVKDQFGGGNFGGGRGFRNAKIKDLVAGGLGFRVFPAMHSLAKKGECTYFHKRHFGYKGLSFKDPTKPVPKPFVCIEKTGADGMTLESCPECRNIERHVKMFDDAAAAAAEKAKSRGIVDKKALEAAVRADPACASLVAWMNEHNLDRKVFFNVLLSDNTYAVLEMGTRARDALKLKCAELRKPPYSIEPISNFDQGAWFTPQCSAPGKQDNVTTFDYTKETISGGGFRVKLAPLSEDVLSRALEVLPDLTDAGLTFLSAQQIDALVKSDGDPTTVDTIMGMSQAKKPAPPGQPAAPGGSSPIPVRDDDDVDTDDGVGDDQPSTPIPPVGEVDEEAAAEAQLAAIRAKKAAAQQPRPEQPAPRPSVAPSPISPASTPEEFRAIFARPAGR